VAEIGIAMQTLGCKVNRAEAEAIASELLATGARIVEPEQAAVVVLTTCTVTGEADRKARKAVRHALALPLAPLVVVTGCLASIDPLGVAALGERVIVEPDKSVVATRVAEALAQVAPATAFDRPEVAPESVFRTRADVKVEDGCDAFCAYCIVPYARGVPRAVPLTDVVARVASLVAAGTAEIVLTGINIGRYRDGEAGLPELIEAVASTGVQRIRVSSIEPLDVDERFLAVAAATDSFCRHLHIPLQSGCDATLAAMGRGYDSATYAGIVRAARAALPGLAVTTDVIAGFPGETDEHFEATAAFCERIGYVKMHVFRYSERRGTVAAERTDQVPPGVRSRRAARLRALGDDMHIRWAAGFEGTRARVLVERVRPADGTHGCVAEGTTREHLRVVLSGEGLCRGDVAEVTLGASDAAGVVAAVRVAVPGNRAW